MWGGSVNGGSYFVSYCVRAEFHSLKAAMQTAIAIALRTITETDIGSILPERLLTACRSIAAGSVKRDLLKAMP